MLVNNVDETPHLLRLKDDEVPPVLEESCEGQSAYLLVADHFGGVIPRVLGDLGVPSSELKRTANGVAFAYRWVRGDRSNLMPASPLPTDGCHARPAPGRQPSVFSAVHSRLPR